MLIEIITTLLTNDFISDLISDDFISKYILTKANISLIQTKGFYAFFFFLGIGAMMIPKNRVNLYVEKKLMRIFYRHLEGYSIRSIKRNKRNIMRILVRLAEVFYPNGVGHTCIWFVYHHKGRNDLVGSLMYEYSIMKDMPSLRIISRNISYGESEKIKQLCDYCMSPEFPGYIFYKIDESTLLDSIGTKNFEASLVFPKIDKVNKRVVYHLNVNFVALPKDENGEPILFEPTPYQLARAKKLLDEVHAVLTNY